MNTSCKPDLDVSLRHLFIFIYRNLKILQILIIVKRLYFFLIINPQKIEICSKYKSFIYIYLIRGVPKTYLGGRCFYNWSTVPKYIFKNRLIRKKKIINFFSNFVDWIIEKMFIYRLYIPNKIIICRRLSSEILQRSK